MFSNPYQLALADALQELTESKERLTDHIFQIAINGELKEWAENIDVGEHFFFSKELLLSLEDEKVKVLISLVEQIEKAISKLHL